MNILILTRTSLKVIRKHTIRSFLTILGIMIGISAIIVTFSIGSGAEKKVHDQIMTMGENAIYAIPGNIIERGTVRSSLIRPPKLKEKDIDAIVKQIPDIAAVTRGHDSLQSVEYGTNSVKERIVGCDTNMLEISNNELLIGNFFTEYHVQQRTNVAVLCYEIAQKLFKGEDPIDQTIQINNIPFTVIGVMEYTEYYWGISNPNMRTFVPFTVAKKYFRKEQEVEDDVGFIGLSIQKNKSAAKALRVVRRVLRFMHNVDENEPDDFTIFDQESISEAAQGASQVIKLFGLIAACISLIVGGIGVMNIMLVSVKERTKEIGIRLALGATQWIVQLQFLIEAIVLTTFGGILGVLLGTFIQYLISNLTNLPGEIEFIPLLISFISTVLTGIFFGYYPARQASLLNPVQALHEK